LEPRRATRDPGGRRGTEGRTDGVVSSAPAPVEHRQNLVEQCVVESWKAVGKIAAEAVFERRD
jgi:hypothetical protein